MEENKENGDVSFSVDAKIGVKNLVIIYPFYEE